MILTIPVTLDVVYTNIIPLLSTEVKTRKFIAISSDTKEEELQNLKIWPKILPRRSKAMWDVLPATEQEAKCNNGKNISFQDQIFLFT